MNKTINPPILWPDAFPLRVVQEPDAGYAIYTRFDDRLGSMNNFAVCDGIQRSDEALWICNALNAAAGFACSATTL